MSKALGQPLKYTDEELCLKAMQFQEANPCFSEAAICGLLRVNRDYIADRAKRSEKVKETREIMTAMRQGAWEQLGIELIKRSSKQTNPLVYIWMTRNMLGWRNDPVTVEAEKQADRSIRLKYRLDDKEKSK